MRIATFNANSIRARMDILLPWLQQARPDILCVQETKAQDKDFPAAALVAAGYHVAFRGEKSYNGVAILSRAAPCEVGYGLDDDGPRDEARLIHARFGTLTVVNTYVPQGRSLDDPMYPYKIQWFQRLRAWFARRYTPATPLVWTGDLNMASSPLDVHHPEEHEDHVCYHVAARTEFLACRDWGFVDVYRKFHPEGGRFSFFDYRVPHAMREGLGWRLDYIFATAPLAARAKSAEIDLAPRRLPRPSDHTPVVADFEWE